MCAMICRPSSRAKMTSLKEEKSTCSQMGFPRKSFTMKHPRPTNIVPLVRQRRSSFDGVMVEPENATRKLVRGRFFYCFLVKLNSFELEELTSSCNASIRLHSLRKTVEESVKNGFLDRGKKLEEHFTSVWKATPDRRVFSIEAQCHCQMRFRGMDPIIYKNEVYHEICISASRRQDIMAALDKIAELLPSVATKAIFFHSMKKSNEQVRVIHRPLSECSDVCYGELIFQTLDNDKEMKQNNNTATPMRQLAQNENKWAKQPREDVPKKKVFLQTAQDGSPDESLYQQARCVTQTVPVRCNMPSSAIASVQNDDAFWRRMGLLMERCVEKALTNTCYEDLPVSINSKLSHHHRNLSSPSLSRLQYAKKLAKDSKRCLENASKSQMEDLEQHSMNDVFTQAPSLEENKQSGDDNSSGTLSGHSNEDAFPCDSFHDDLKSMTYAPSLKTRAKSPKPGAFAQASKQQQQQQQQQPMNILHQTLSQDPIPCPRSKTSIPKPKRNVYFSTEQSIHMDDSKPDLMGISSRPLSNSRGSRPSNGGKSNSAIVHLDHASVKPIILNPSNQISTSSAQLMETLRESLDTICDQVHFDYPHVHGRLGEVEFYVNVNKNCGHFRLPFSRVSQDLLAHNAHGELTSESLRHLCKKWKFLVKNVKVIESQRADSHLPSAYLQANCQFASMHSLDSILQSLHELIVRTHRR